MYAFASLFCFELAFEKLAELGCEQRCFGDQLRVLALQVTDRTSFSGFKRGFV